MIENSLKYIKNNLINLSGKTIRDNLIVFESDDWGTLRIPSLNAIESLPAHSLGNNPFNRFDTLESKEDLERLFDVLEKYKDYKGNSPVFTANFIVGNPDFEKIRKDNFEKYSWESIKQTYLRYHPEDNVLNTIYGGIAKKYFFPQFHGREHLNAFRWIELLVKASKVLRQAFDAEVFCIDIELGVSKRDNLMAAFDYWDNRSKYFLQTHLKEGMQEFSRLFGYKSKSFIAPCNVWDSFTEEVLRNEGALYIQSLHTQQVPSIGLTKYTNKKNVIGDRSLYNQLYSVRNVYFEPSTRQTYDWIGNALNKISAAFRWGKPAVISTHRINYVGGIQQDNRKKGLEKLSVLIKEILKRWPEVEFVTSEQLGDKLARQ